MCMQPEHGSGLQPRHGSGPSEDLGMTTVADKYEYQADSSYKNGMCPLTQLYLGTLCSLHEARTTRLVPSPLRLTPAVIMLHATTTHGQGHGHGHRLLTRGANGSLSLVWIAATLGPKAHLKRISKREIVSLNVPAACRLIAEPTPDGETMPLRISSTLLSGVSRVYGQQYNLHFNNVINVIDQIRLHMSSKRPTDITLDQPKVSDENRVETITLPLYPDIDLFGPAITLDMPTFLPPLTPIAPAAFPEEFLPAPGGAPLGFRAGTPSMELGRGYEPTGIGMASDLTTSDFGGYAGGYVFPESARAGADQESPSFVSSTTRTSISTRRVSGLRAAAGAGAGPIPTISELAMAEEREHGIMDLDLGLDLPPIPAQVAGQEDIGGPLGFERMSPLLRALPSLSPEPGARPPRALFGEPMIPPLMIEEEHPATFHEEEQEEPLQDLEPLPKRRRVVGPRHPRLDQMTELPAAYWRDPPILQRAMLLRPATPNRDEVLDRVFGPLIADINEDFAGLGRVHLFARQQARLEHEEFAPVAARIPPPPAAAAEEFGYPAYAERMYTPEPETRRARSVSADLGHLGDVSIEPFRPPYAFGIEDLTAEQQEPPRLPSDLESPGRVAGFVPPISPIMGPGLMSDISSMASRPEPQLLFPPSPMLEPMREMTEEPADISTAQYASAMQQQSFNFYQRTKVLLEASATGELVFDDMLPARTRVVAAQAFYHLLTLATQRKLKVHQEAPYEAITVMGVEEEEERETMEEL